MDALTKELCFFCLFVSWFLNVFISIVSQKHKIQSHWANTEQVTNRKTFPLHDTPSSLLPQQIPLIPVQAPLLEKVSLTTHILPSHTSLTSTLLSQPASHALFPLHTSHTCTLRLAHQPHKHPSPCTPALHALFVHTSLTCTLPLTHQPHMHPSSHTPASQTPFPSHTNLTRTLLLAYQPHKHPCPRIPASHATFPLHISLYWGIRQHSEEAPKLCTMVESPEQLEKILTLVPHHGILT